MKTKSNKSFNYGKVIIPTLAMLMGVSVVGSICGTMAWYQYSTKASAAYIGESVALSKNLLVKNSSGNWVSDLSSTEVAKLVKANYGTSLTPVTTGGFIKNAALSTLYTSPDYSRRNLLADSPYSNTSWYTASTANYVQFDLELKSITGNDTLTANNVYLTDVTIKQDSTTSTKDISNAIRVQLSTGTEDGSTNVLFAKSATTTLTHGYLDLNGDGKLDTVGNYEWDSQDPVLYGGSTSQTSYSIADNDGYIASLNTDNKYSTKTENKSIGSTTTSGDGSLKVTVTIWIEGWDRLTYDGYLGSYSESDATESYTQLSLGALELDGNGHGTLGTTPISYTKSSDNVLNVTNGTYAYTITLSEGKYTAVAVTKGEDNTSLFNYSTPTNWSLDLDKAKFDVGLSFGIDQ